MSRFLDPHYNALAPYTPGEQPKNRQLIKLNTNENPYPPAPGVQDAVREAAGSLQLYSDLSCASVTEPLARQLGVKREQVLLGNGSDELLAFCFQAFCPNGVAFADLTYGFYPVYASLYGVETQIIPLAEDFTLNPQDYAGVRRTLFFANPNAPTGLAFSRAQLEQVLQWNKGSLVIVDEAYVDFGAESSVPLLEKFDNLLVIGTFSKSRNLAGARLGYAVGSPELIADLGRIRFSFNPYNVNAMTQAAGAATLADTGYFKQCCAKIVATRQRSLEALEKLGFACTASQTNFLFASHPDMEAQELYERLRAKHILVRWFNVPRIRNHLRITVGTDAQMDTLLEEMEAILRQAGIHTA